MSTSFALEKNQELTLLCGTVRTLLKHSEFQECELLISEAMGKHPHDPQPHNLFGVLFEQEGKHTEAMKHFRAAWALDPSYLPARCNMDHYGSFSYKGKYAIDETDCNMKHLWWGSKSYV